ncbi:kinase-like domain-containing protein [Obelidium mucronatum]|nr:kinase-like domain-containing protein [Obelidium mucronatum]
MGAACCKPEVIDFAQEVDLNHFELLRSIGKGAFGKVKVVKHKNTKNTYALKYINKEACIKMKAVDNIIQERKLLEEIHCPFVCNLRYAFQDDENMFMVIDLKLGGDLRFHLNKLGTLAEDVVRFYMAECALGLMYLHSKHVVHRDLKPDNILLDENGHACLTDFNIATYWKDDKPLNAVAGSMAYMAPEILDRVGYTYTIDWWSLGVIAYELLLGKRPFRGSTNEELTSSITKGKLEFPANVDKKISNDGVEMIKGWLTRPAADRLGSKQTGGDTKITNHDWFKEYNWSEMEKLLTTPPFVPDSKKANFDATHELEEMLLEDNPLQAKPRKKDGKGGAVSKLDPKEAEKMETKYTLFDYTTLPPFELRKKSGAWDAKVGEIQRSASSLNRESKVDIMENRSECILIDPDQQTIKSMANSASELPVTSTLDDAPELPRPSAASGYVTSPLANASRLSEVKSNTAGEVLF